jgi:SWI/SNF-related matrix-associated actin-dependent regulator of chromatin subfamily A protein 2/4
MPIQVLDAQGNVVHTLDARTNPQARQQAEMMAASMGGSVNELPYEGGPPGGPQMGGPQMGGMMPPGMGGLPPGGPPPGLLQRMGENRAMRQEDRAMRREDRRGPPGGGQLNGGSPTIPGGPGEAGGEVPQQLMAQQGGGPPQRPNHLEVIRMMMEEEARGLVQGDQGPRPLENQLAGMPPIMPPMLAPPQIPGMQGPQGMPGMPPQGPPGMPPGMPPQGPMIG